MEQMKEHGKIARKSHSWIELFVELNSTKPTPELFRKWSAISILAGAMERRCWVRTTDTVLYPNLFVLLVSPPGVGKSRIISEVEILWRSVKDFNVAPKSVTKAALVDALGEKGRRMLMSSNEMLEYHSMLVPSSEFGVLVPSHDLEFLNVLNDIYDSPKLYSERRRSIKEPINITNPQLNIIAGTQPAYLAALFPETAFGMGFFSRIIMIYAGSTVRPQLFGSNTEIDPRHMDLKHDLHSIANLHGEFTFSKEAQRLITEWYEADCPPRPEHIKLIHYGTRRILHALKLCMVKSISRGNSLHIMEQDVDWALRTLFEAEAYMPEIFTEMGASPDSQILGELYYFLLRLYSKEKKLVSESRLVNFLSNRTPTNRIKDMLEVLIRSGMADRTATPSGLYLYRPLNKDEQQARY